MRNQATDCCLLRSSRRNLPLVKAITALVIFVRAMGPARGLLTYDGRALRTVRDNCSFLLTERMRVIRVAISTRHDPVVALGDARRGPGSGYRCVLPWLALIDARRVLDGAVGNPLADATLRNWPVLRSAD